MQSMSLGEWEHSTIFTEVHTAKDWGMTPKQFRSLEPEEQAEMIAHDRAWSEMRNYIEFLQNKLAEEKSKSKGKK